MPPTGWQWNQATKEYVYWSSQHACWISERGKQVKNLDKDLRDQTRENVPPPPNPAGGSLRRGSEASKDASIAESFRRVDLRGESDPGPTGGSTSAAHIKTTQAQAGLRAITAKDERTGLRTHWLLGEQGKYTDPKTSQTRSAMPKYVRRSVHEESRKGDASGKDMVSREKGKAKYDVIEVRIVPPPVPTGISAASGLISNALREEGDRVRFRRYVVVEERPGGEECFRAIHIKTYNQEGVAQQIKFHHSQIYSGKKKPILDSEKPRIRNGAMESPMQTRAIGVRMFDRERALDPMSRLDYFDATDFEYGDPQVRVVGCVERDSRPALSTQYRNVVETSAASIRGPTNPAPTGGQAQQSKGGAVGGGVGSAGAARPPANSAYASGHAQQREERTAAVASSSSGLAYGSAAPPPVRRENYPSGQGEQRTRYSEHPAPRRDNSTIAADIESAETVTVAQLNMMLQNLRNYGERNGLKWPLRAELSKAQLEKRANDRKVRETTLQQIRDSFKNQIRKRQEENDSEEEDDRST